MCYNASLQVFKLYGLLGGKRGGGGWQKNRQQVRSQLQRSEKPLFASFGQGRFKPQFWASLNHPAQNRFWAPICPKLPKTYFCAPICQKKLPQTYFESPICPKIVLHLIVQNLFLATYLSKTAQNLFKDFDGYVEMASDLVFCYRMLHGSNELGYQCNEFISTLVNYL